MYCKVYELKKGMKLNRDGEVLTFEGIFGNEAVFLNEYYQEVKFDDFLDIEEIGEIVDFSYCEESEVSVELLF